MRLIQTKVITPAAKQTFIDGERAAQATHAVQVHMKRLALYQTYETKLLIDNPQSQCSLIELLIETPLDLSQPITITDEAGDTFEDFYAAEDALIPKSPWPSNLVTLTYSAGWSIIPEAIEVATEYVRASLLETEKNNYDEIPHDWEVKLGEQGLLAMRERLQDLRKPNMNRVSPISHWVETMLAPYTRRGDSSWL